MVNHALWERIQRKLFSTVGIVFFVTFLTLLQAHKEVHRIQQNQLHFRTFHVCGAVLSLILMLLSIDPQGRYNYNNVWMLLIYKDVTTLVMIFAAAYWMDVVLQSYTTPMGVTSPSKGRYSKRLGLFMLICIILNITSTCVALGTDKRQYRVVWEGFVVAVCFSGTFFVLYILKRSELYYLQVQDRYKPEVSLDIASTMRKLKISALCSFAIGSLLAAAIALDLSADDHSLRNSLKPNHPNYFSLGYVVGLAVMAAVSWTPLTSNPRNAIPEYRILR